MSHSETTPGQDQQGNTSDSFRPSPHKAEYNLRWVLAHEPPVVFDEAAKVFEDMIRENSSGDIDVQLFRGDEYKSEITGKRATRAELVAGLQRGDIEMAHCYTSALGAVHERLWAIELPFLFRDYGHADAVWEGPAAKMLMDGMPEVGLRGIAFAYSGGFRIVPTREREIHTLADYQGLRLRTAGNPVPEALYRRLGGSAIGAPLEAIRGMHEAGDIDGCEITFVRYEACGLDEVFPVINATSHSLFTTMTVMNDAWFCSLPERHQATVVEAAEAACRVERATAIKAETATRAKFEARGLKVVTMAPAEHAELARIGSELHEEFVPRFGAELISTIRDTRSV